MPDSDVRRHKHGEEWEKMILIEEEPGKWKSDKDEK